MEYGEALNSSDDLKGRDSVDLLARMIYAEAQGESFEGKCGVAFVAQNRKDHPKKAKEFGGTTWEAVLLSPNQFSVALKPNTKSQAWADCLDIAQNLSDKTNPIGSCLWFNANDVYAKRSQTVNGVEQYAFSKGKYKDVVEKCVIGGHTFFRIIEY